MAVDVSRQIRWAIDDPCVRAWPAVAAPAEAEVIVVGAGVTGLSTALHLAEQHVSVIVIEANTVGLAATGRSGGQIVPGFKAAPGFLERSYGDDGARKMRAFAFEAADYVFGLIDRLKIDCSPTRNGWIQAAVSSEIGRRLQVRADELTRAGADVQFLSREDMQRATGSSFYWGGLNERAAGAVHPLKLARGLAQAADARGAMIFENSKATALRRAGGRWRLDVNGQPLHGSRVVLATDAYTAGLFPDLGRSFLSVSSAQIATEPLPADVLGAILPWRAGISEARKIPYYCRIDPQGRFLIGGRGPDGDLIDGPTIARLRSAALARFPQLRAVKWDYGWLGKVGLTLDDTPRLTNPAKDLWAAYGYSGRGLALAIRMGKTLAEAAGGTATSTDYPLTPLRPLRWHWLRQPAISTALAWYRTRDALGFPV